MKVLYMGSSFVLLAELWGIYSALFLGWDNQFSYIWVESDSSIVVKLQEDIASIHY